MTAQPVRRRYVRAAALLAVASVASSCVDVQERTPETSTPDSAGGAVATVSTPAPVRGSFGADSAISLRGASGPEEIVAALRTDTAYSLEVVDSAPSSMPTDADLATLRREMMVPVPGVAVSALYDSYDEVRGGTRGTRRSMMPSSGGFT
jgi:hypothetical protein